MNSISWLLYAAEVADNVRGVAHGTLAAACILAIFGPIVVGVFIMEFHARDALKGAAKHVGKAVAALVVAVLVLVFFPSRTTIMLIATSEVGEAVILSEQAQQMGGEAGELAVDSLRVLRNFINEQLADAAPAAE